MSSSVHSAAAPHRSDSQRSSASQRPRVHFRRGVDVRRVGPRQISPQVHRQPPPAAGSAELETEAAQVIQALDAARCDVSNTDRPIDNGLRQQRERQQSGYGSLSRASLRRKKTRPGLKSISTNTLPPPARNGETPEPTSPKADIEADKNNIIKAENLLRETRGSLLHVDGLLKRSSSQVDHLNNLNSLKENEEKHKRNNYRDDPLESEILPPYKPDRDSEKFDKGWDTVDHRLSDGGVRISVTSDAPTKHANSASQTSPRRSMPRAHHRDPGVGSLAASTVAAMSTPFMHQRDASPPPPPRPERTPPKAPSYKPRGFSYLAGPRDINMIERERADSDTSQSKSVIAQSHNIIEQIRRERSRSPDGRPVRRESPPELVVPTQHPTWMRTVDHDCPPEVERSHRRDHHHHDREHGHPDRAARHWNDSPEHTWQYRDDSPPETRGTQRFDVPPPEVKTFYHTSQGPQITKTYYQDMNTPHESPRRGTRGYESDSPPGTTRSSRSRRYETDSSGEPRVYRDESPGQSPNTRTYRFTSGSERTHHQADTSRLHVHQQDRHRSPHAPETPEVMQRTSSIVMIGVDDPEPEPVNTSPRRPGFSRLSTLVEDSLPGDSENPHYQVPRYQSPSTGRDGDKVIRISVSGSHSSSNRDSPAETRNTRTTVTRTAAADRYHHEDSERTHRRTEERRRRTEDSHSREDSPPGRRRHSETPPRHISSSSESPRRHRGSSDPHDPINGHGGRSSEPPSASGTLEKVRRRTTRDKDSLSSRHRGEKKKKISIKFMYDDDPEKPAERLAKYTEYTGSEDAPPPDSPTGQRRPSDSRDGWKTDKFLTNLIEESRPEGSERRDGRRVTPPPSDGYDRKPHGVWSSRSEEDLVDAGYRKSHRTTQSTTTSRRTREDREKRRSSVSSEEGRRRRSRDSKDREDSRDRRSPDRETRDRRSPDRETKDRRSPPRRSSRDRSSSPEPGKSPKTNWLSATLSRLDLKSKKGNKDNAGKNKDGKSPNKDKEGKSPSKNNTTPRKDSPSDKDRSVSRSVSRAAASSSGRRTVERREHRSSRGYSSSGQDSSGRRRRGDPRSDSRDSHATSEERDFSSAERPHRRRARSSEERGSVPRGSSELRDTQPRQPSSSRPGSRMRDRRYFSDDGRRGGKTDRPSVSRTASFSRRYPEVAVDETDGSRQGTVGRRAGRRISSGTETTPTRSHRHRRSGTSSVNSSGSDVGSPGAATSHTSNRSVFLHATTVADIPANATAEPAPAAEDEPLPARERRKVHRSFSVRSPFKLQHKNDREINYENKGSNANANGGSAGRPPRAPRTRRDSRDTELEEPTRDRAESRSSRYSSTLPKGSRTSSRHYRTAERPAR